MKISLYLSLFLLLSVSAFSQGLWVPKATPPNNNPDNVSFTLGTIGYIYTGTATNNFYAYDPATNTWAAKANFPGAARRSAAGFATTGYGYVGSGKIANAGTMDFYKYDPMANSWSSIPNCPANMSGSFAFGIGNTGYLAGGFTDTAAYLHFAYNESTNTWSAKARLPLPMGNGFSAVANSKGYCGLGQTNNSAHADSVYEYNPVADSWSAKAPIHLNGTGYNNRLNAFVINHKIYVADPEAQAGPHGGMRIFNVLANTWSSINTFPYSAYCTNFISTSAFSIANKGYMGGSASCPTNTFWEYDTAHNFTISAFTPDTVCEGGQVSVTFSSNLSFGGSNFFRLGVQSNGGIAKGDSIAGSAGGTYTFRVPYGSLTGSSASSFVSIFSTDPAGQSSYFTSTLFVKKAPKDLNMPDAFSSCGGSAILLYRDNTSGQTHTWSSDPPGVSGSASTLSFTPTATTSIFAYDVYTATGCSLRDTAIVSVYGSPALNISDSSFAICPGSSVSLGGTHTIGSSYTWSGSGLSSNSVNPLVSPTTNAVYHVVVHDTVTTCSISSNTTVTIKQAPAQTICFVTVDATSTHNVIVWEKLNKYATDSFHIYREASTNNYIEIAAIHRDSLSEYHDYSANPNVTAYRYKISASDTCSNASAQSHYHNTIHLQSLGGGNLIWNVYGIENETTPVNSFDIYWDTLANGNWQVMLNVPGSQSTATDINFANHTAAKYRIIANWSYSCTAARSGSSQVLSNVITLIPTSMGDIASDQNLMIYPNPAQNQLYVVSTEKVQEVSILSADGKLITIISEPAGNKLDVSYLAAGIYIAEVRVNNAIKRVKWLKM